MPNRRPLALRAAAIADSDFVFDMHEKTMRGYVDLVWGWDHASQRASHDRTHPAPGTHVIFHGESLVGVVQFEEREDALWVGRLEIDPARHGQGLGAEVVELVSARAAERGLRLRLRVLEVNVGALRFYERLQFRPLGRVEPHIYLERDERRTPTSSR